MKERFRHAATGGCTCPPGLPCVCDAVQTVRLLQAGRVDADRGRGRSQPPGRVGPPAGRREAAPSASSAGVSDRPDTAGPGRRGAAREPRPLRVTAPSRRRAGADAGAHRSGAPRPARSSRAAVAAGDAGVLPSLGVAASFGVMLGLVAFQAVHRRRTSCASTSVEQRAERGPGPATSSCAWTSPSSSRPTASSPGRAAEGMVVPTRSPTSPRRRRRGRRRCWRRRPAADPDPAAPATPRPGRREAAASSGRAMTPTTSRSRRRPSTADVAHGTAVTRVARRAAAGRAAARRRHDRRRPARRRPRSWRGGSARRRLAWPCSSLLVLLVGAVVGARRHAADRRPATATPPTASASASRTSRSRPSAGAIFDRNGYELALSVPQRRCGPTRAPWSTTAGSGRPRSAAAARRSTPTRPPRSPHAAGERRSSSTSPARSTTPRPRRSPDLELPGVYRTTSRSASTRPATWPAACSGRTDTDGKGIAGLEEQYDDDAHRRARRADPRARPAGPHASRAGAHQLVPAEPGDDLVLTIDRTLQYETEQALPARSPDPGAEGGTAIVMDTATGDMLAMANVDRRRRRPGRSVSPANLAVDRRVRARLGGQDRSPSSAALEEGTRRPGHRAGTCPTAARSTTTCTSTTSRTTTST